jgi:hypothetical protein
MSAWSGTLMSRWSLFASLVAAAGRDSQAVGGAGRAWRLRGRAVRGHEKSPLVARSAGAHPLTNILPEVHNRTGQARLDGW